MSTLRDLKRFQRACAKRGSLEEKTRIFEENARKAKLAIDMDLLVQVLQEENRTHDEAVKELDEKLREEKRAHDEAVKELEEKIADLQTQIKSSSDADYTPIETPSDPVQETTEPSEETPIVEEQVNFDAFEDARALVRESKPIESEVPPEEPKKKKRRGLF